MKNKNIEKIIKRSDSPENQRFDGNYKKYIRNNLKTGMVLVLYNGTHNKLTFLLLGMDYLKHMNRQNKMIFLLLDTGR